MQNNDNQYPFPIPFLIATYNFFGRISRLAMTGLNYIFYPLVSYIARKYGGQATHTFRSVYFVANFLAIVLTISIGLFSSSISFSIASLIMAFLLIYIIATTFIVQDEISVMISIHDKQQNIGIVHNDIGIYLISLIFFYLFEELAMFNYRQTVCANTICHTKTWVPIIWLLPSNMWKIFSAFGEPNAIIKFNGTVVGNVISLLNYVIIYTVKLHFRHETLKYHLYYRALDGNRLSMRIAARVDSLKRPFLNAAINSPNLEHRRNAMEICRMVGTIGFIKTFIHNLESQSMENKIYGLDICIRLLRNPELREAYTLEELNTIMWKISSQWKNNKKNWKVRSRIKQLQDISMAMRNKNQ